MILHAASVYGPVTRHFRQIGFNLDSVKAVYVIDACIGCSVKDLLNLSFGYNQVPMKKNFLFAYISFFQLTELQTFKILWPEVISFLTLSQGIGIFSKKITREIKFYRKFVSLSETSTHLILDCQPIDFQSVNIASLSQLIDEYACAIDEKQNSNLDALCQIIFKFSIIM